MDNSQFFPALAVVWVFGFAAVLLIAWHLRSKRRMEKLQIIHAERMKAMEKGIPLPEFPELGENEGGALKALASNLASKRLNPRWPLGVGVLLIMGGLGTAVAMRMSAGAIVTADGRIHSELWPFGLIGVFLGIGMFLFYALTRTAADKP